MFRINKLIFITFISVIMAACSGGGGSSSTSESTTPETIPSGGGSSARISLTGAVSKGPVMNAAVNIYTFNTNGTQGSLVIGGIITDAYGAWSANIPSTATGPFMIVATGGSFIDEYTGTTVPLGAVPLRGIMPAGATSAAITPITDAAVSTIQQMVSDGYASSPANALTTVQTNYVNSFGFDPLTVIPPAPEKLATANAQERQYAAILGGISTLANDAYTQLSTGANTPNRMEIIAQMANDFATDGSIDGYGNAATPLSVNVGGSPQALNTVFTGGGNLSAAVGTYQGLPSAPSQVTGAAVTITPVDFTTTVYVDTTNPVVTPPANITTVSTDAVGIAAFLNGATATDNIAVVGAITNNAPNTLPTGATLVTFTATDAAGNIGTASTTITITPTASTYTVSGTISGITTAIGLEIRNASGSFLGDVPSPTNGSFTFNVQLNNGESYDVQTVFSACTITNGTGTINGANVTNVAIDCASTNSGPTAGLAASGKHWAKLSPSAPIPINLSGSLVVGNGSEIKMYRIGIRSLGTVRTSTVYTTVDGINWAETTFNTPTFQIKYMAWNGSKYIAIAFSADGKNSLVTNSSDGTTWATPVDLGTVVNPLAIGSNGTRTIIAGSNGYIASSTDLVTWTTRVARDKFRQVYHIQGISWTGTQFIATGTRGHISTSPDGITWTDRTNIAVAGIGSTLSDAVSVAGKTFIKLRPAGAFVASPKTIISSTDGISWVTSLTPDSASSSNRFHQPSIAKTGELLISYSEFVNFQEVRYELSSSDGITFKVDDINAVTAFNAGDVVFDRGGGIGHVFSLPTGTYSVMNRLSSGLAIYKRQ
ncbi:MAG: HYR domain-containing protein [Ghiorsea sp.]